LSLGCAADKSIEMRAHRHPRFHFRAKSRPSHPIDGVRPIVGFGTSMTFDELVRTASSTLCRCLSSPGRLRHARLSRARSSFVSRDQREDDLTDIAAGEVIASSDRSGHFNARFTAVMRLSNQPDRHSSQPASRSFSHANRRIRDPGRSQIPKKLKE